MGLLDFLAKPIKLRKSMIPKHVAFYLKLTPDAEAGTLSKGVQRLTIASAKMGVIITSFYVLATDTPGKGIAPIFDELVLLCMALKKWPALTQRSIRINVIGHWYDLPTRVVDPLRELQELTRLHTGYVLNLCVNYDGQQEIIDACTILARQIKMGKLDPDRVNKDVIKQYLYTSDMPGPELVIKSGPMLSLEGFLLWDTAHSTIFFTKRTIGTMTGVDYLRGVEYYQKVKLVELKSGSVGNSPTTPIDTTFVTSVPRALDNNRFVDTSKNSTPIHRIN